MPTTLRITPTCHAEALPAYLHSYLKEHRPNVHCSYGVRAVQDCSSILYMWFTCTSAASAALGGAWAPPGVPVGRPGGRQRSAADRCAAGHWQCRRHPARSRRHRPRHARGRRRALATTLLAAAAWQQDLIGVPRDGRRARWPLRAAGAAGPPLGPRRSRRRPRCPAPPVHTRKRTPAYITHPPEME